MRSGDYDNYKTQLHIVAWYDYKNKYNATNLTNLQYRRILMDFCDLVMEEVFNNPDGFEIPNKFGTLQMIGLPFNPKKIIGHRAKVYKLVRTEGYAYSLRWLRMNYRCKIKNIYLFKFKTGLLIQRKIIKAINEDRFFGWLRLDNFFLIGRLLDPELKQEVGREKVRKIINRKRMLNNDTTGNNIKT